MKKVLLSLLVALLAVSSVFAGGSSEAASAGQSGAAAETVFAGGWPYSTVPTGHFNMFVSNAIELKFWREVHQLPLATYDASTGEYNPMLAQSWEISDDGTVYTVHLRDDAKWLSGDNFTSKDVWTTFMIYRLVGNPVWNYIDGMNIVDDYTIEFTISNPTTMLHRYILRKPIVDYLTYGSFADRADEIFSAGLGTDSAEYNELVSQFNTFRPDFVNATGPYYLDPDLVSQSYVEMPKNPNSFLADTVQFDKLIIYNGDVPDLTPLVLNKQVDYLTHQFPSSSIETFKALGYKTIQIQGMDGIAMYFNCAVKPLDSTAVRQAISYVIDRERVGQLALPGVTRGTEYVSGLGDSMTETWVDTSLLDNYDVDYDKAAALLEGEGLYKKDGQWYLPDGKQFTLQVQCPASWSDASAAASEIAQQLTNFGIRTTFIGIEESQRQTNINEGNFQLALSFFGTAQPHPMFAFETPLLMSNVNASHGLGYSMIQETEDYGTVNLEDLIYESTEGWDEEAQKESIEKLVVTLNKTVPYLPLYTKWSQNLSSDGLRTQWTGDEGLYLNSPGDDSFTVIKLLSGDIKPL